MKRVRDAYSTELDVEKLCSYIEQQVKGFKLDRTVYQFSFGQSCARVPSPRLHPLIPVPDVLRSAPCARS